MYIREMATDDIEQVLHVEKVAWGDRAATPENIAIRARIFGEGSLVAVQDEQVVGYAAAQLTSHISTSCWAEQTDNGTLVQTHKPGGRLAYGVSMSALPGVSGEGVAYHVIDHYTRIFLQTGRCSALCVGSRLPGLARWANKQTDHPILADYVQRATNGRYIDPELRLYAANGFRVLWELPEYFVDRDSMNHGAMVIRTQ